MYIFRATSNERMSVKQTSIRHNQQVTDCQDSENRAPIITAQY